MLRRLCIEQPRQWNRYINALLFACGEVPQESTGFRHSDYYTVDLFVDPRKSYVTCGLKRAQKMKLRPVASMYLSSERGSRTL
jgi:hypothetical protein